MTPEDIRPLRTYQGAPPNEDQTIRTSVEEDGVYRCRLFRGSRLLSSGVRWTATEIAAWAAADVTTPSEVGHAQYDAAQVGAAMKVAEIVTPAEVRT